MTEKGIRLVKAFEGFSPTLYYDPVGIPTIGYGIVVDAEKYKNVILTKEAAEALLFSELIKTELMVRKLLKYKELHPYCYDALTSFSFNVGIGNFSISTLRKKILRGELYDAANEFEKWIYAGGRILKGLIRRRKAEKELYLEGLALQGV
ncbi:MAG: lysozyme [Candidatus Aenigmatarchaeota archaeon]